MTKTTNFFTMASLAVLLASSPLRAEAADELIELNERHLELVAPQELIALDTSTFLQPSIPQQDLQMPAPILQVPRRKNALLAAGLSGIIPGLGHGYLGDWKTAGGFMGATGVGIGLSAFSGSNEAFQYTNLITLQATSFYGIYAAYRDARLYNGQIGYSYKMPTDNLADLTSAPFRWSVMKKPEVWGGLLGSLALATAVSYFFFPEKSEAHVGAAISNPWFPIVALPIGIGEESFFRGFLMPQFSEWTTPWGGIALSSVVFGAMHIPNALVLEPEDRNSYYVASLPLITALGVYCGWLTHKNHSLKESVALHTWYDFTIFALSTFANQAMIKGPTGFSISIPF